jgi:hypothetical protein
MKIKENQITTFTEDLQWVSKNWTLSQCPGRAPVQEIGVSRVEIGEKLNIAHIHWM